MIYTVVALSALLAFAAAAPHHSKISCYQGTSEDNEVAHGFTVCEATYDFVSNTAELTGRHHAKSPAFTDRQVPGMSETRKQECQIKSSNGGMVVSCFCYESRCNSPVTPKELLEEKFANL